MTPLELMQFNIRTATMMMEASTVMTMRMLAMGGIIPARRGENKRMVEEKSKAMAKSATAAGLAMMQGKRPDQVMEAAMKPISQRVRANRKRLTKR